MLAVLDAYRHTHPRRREAYIRLHHPRRRDPAYGDKLGVAAWRLPRWRSRPIADDGSE